MFSKEIIWHLVIWCLSDDGVGHRSRDCALAGFKHNILQITDETRKGDQKERLFKTQRLCLWLGGDTGSTLVVGNYSSVEYRFCETSQNTIINQRRLNPEASHWRHWVQASPRNLFLWLCIQAKSRLRKCPC